MAEIIQEHTGVLVVMRCFCGIQHAVPNSLANEQRRQHNKGETVMGIFCPLGHQHSPSGVSTSGFQRKEKTMSDEAKTETEIEGLGYRETTHRWNCSEVVVYHTLALNLQAKLAMAMVERWGSVAGVPDGVDAAGRQKLKLQTPEELVTRACKTARLCIEAFRTHDWLLVLPAPKDIPRTTKD